MLKNGFFALSAILVLLLAVPAPAKDFTVLTNQLPPIKMVRDDTATGIMGDVLTRLMVANGKCLGKGDARHLPLAEAFNMVRDTPGTIYLAMLKLPKWEPQFKWVGPVYNTTISLIGRADRPFRVRKTTDALPYTVGAVRGSAAAHLAVSQGFPEDKLVLVDRVAEAVDKLIKGDIDLLAFPKSPTFYEMLRQGMDPNQFKAVHDMKSMDLYFAFNRNTDDALIHGLQQALDLLKKRGPDGNCEYDAIVNRYFMPAI